MTASQEPTSDQIQDTQIQDTQIQDTPVVTEPTIETTSESAEREDIRVEEYKINGDALVSKVKELIHEGNIRRIIIKNEEGHTLLEIPLTVGVVGGVVTAALFPVVAALGAIGALVAHLTIVIEKKI